MNAIIHQRGIALDDAQRDRFMKKANKLNRFFDDDAEVSIRLSAERPARQIAELTVTLRDGTVLRVEEITTDLSASVDNAIEKIIRRLRKHRTKLEKRLREGAFDAPSTSDSEPPEFDSEDSGELVRVKRFAMKPMSAEDAIEQMDLLGHSFFLFIEAASGTTCVVYKRRDGKVGMLQSVNG